MGQIEQHVAKACPGATVIEGLAIKGSNAAVSADAVAAWLA